MDKDIAKDLLAKIILSDISAAAHWHVRHLAQVVLEEEYDAWLKEVCRRDTLGRVKRKVV